MIEVESAIPEGLGHVGGAVFTQDVEGEASGTGHDSGIVSDAAFVLVTRDITDIVVAVLDAPVASNGRSPFGCWDPVGGRDIEGDLAALVPQTGSGGLQ
jgi:hypothetical protein